MKYPRRLFCKLFIFSIFISFFSLLFIIDVNTSYAQVVVSPTKSSLPTLTSTDNPANVNFTNQVDILQAQLDIMDKYNDKLLTMSDIFIGVIITVIVSIFAFNFYINNVRYKKDIAKMESKLESNFNSFISIKLSAINKQNSSYFMDAQSDINSQFNDMKRNILELEAIQWNLQKIYKNAIDKYIKIIEIDPNHHLVYHYLGELCKAIENCDSKFNQHNVEPIERIIRLVYDENKIISDKIMKLLSEKYE